MTVKLNTKNTTTLRVANYYRVSTKLQQDRFSLAAQETELRAYINRQGWKLIGEFIDIESGGKLDKSGLNALLDLVESGEIDAVVVMDQDRLSRLDTISWEYLKSVLRENDVKIAEPNGTLTDLSDEDDEFMSDLKNLLARREKKKVVKRMMYGKRQRLREGKGWGRAPFEYYYDKEKERYFIKPGWEWTIPFIDDLYLNKNLGMKAIANELNMISKTPTGKKWNEHLVYTRLTSKVFHGYQEMDFSNGETIAAKVYEPMRTEETYRKIQEVRKKRAAENGVHFRGSDINIHLLKYVPVTCGYCGRIINVQQGNKVTSPRFYAFHGRKERFNGEICDININVKRYEYNMIKAIREILLSKELASKYINFESNESEIKELQGKINKASQSLKKLNESRDKLIDLYLTTDLNKDVYTAKNKELESKIKVTEENIEKLNRKLTALQKEEWSYENLISYLDIASDFGVSLTRHEQAKVISELFTKAVLTDEKLVLTTEIFNGIPFEVTVDVVDNVWTVNKWIRRDKEDGRLFYTE